MKHVKIWWLVVLGLLVLPQVALLAAGTVWLAERRLLLYWLGGGGALTLAGWGLARLLRAKRMAPISPTVEPAPTWPPTGHAAWQDVEAIAQRVESEDLPLDRPQALWGVLVEVLQAVARHYHPNRSQPELEIPAPYVLRVVELVAYDLRNAFSEYVPGSHVLTLGDLLRLRRLAAWAREAFLLYRVARLGYNPVGALLREIRQLATGRLQDTSARGIRRWAQGFCVRRAGYYAIQLYGGHLVLDDVAFADYQTRQSQRDAQRAEAQGAELEEEPLRILVVGQVKSGKSSLVNALFGEVRAAVDVVPTTRYVEPYVLEREGIARAIILDTAGYEKVEGPDDAFDELRGQILDCDLMLVVCSATSAARGPDRRLLDRIRASLEEQPDRMMPPLVAVSGPGGRGGPRASGGAVRGAGVSEAGRDVQRGGRAGAGHFADGLGGPTREILTMSAPVPRRGDLAPALAPGRQFRARAPESGGSLGTRPIRLVAYQREIVARLRIAHPCVMCPPMKGATCIPERVRPGQGTPQK